MMRLFRLFLVLPIFAVLLGGCDQAPDVSRMSIEQLLQYGHFPEAQTKINQLWTNDSTSAEALYAKGLLAEYSGCEYEALIMHKLAILADRGYVPALKNYMHLAITMKEYNRAQTIGEHWLSIAPNDTLVYIYLARLALDQYKLEEADTLLDRAAAQGNDNVLIDLYRTELEVRSDDNSRIDQALQNIDPVKFTSKDHYSQMAEIYDYLNQHDSTVAYAQKAVETDPEDIYLKSKLAWYLLNTRSILAADELVLSMLDTSPQFGPALILNAYTKKYIVGGIQGEIAIQDFMKTVPEFPESREIMGDFFYYYDDYTSALFAYQSALSNAVTYNYPASYIIKLGLKLGRFLLDTGQFPEGRSLYEKMIKVAPNNREWLFMNAEFMHFFSEVQDSAYIYANRYVREAPNDETTIYSMAKFYKSGGDFDNAITNYKRLLTLPHPEKDYYLRLLDIYLFLEKQKDAWEIADNLPRRFQNDFEINEMLYKISMRTDNPDRVLQYAKKLGNMAPYHLPYISQLYRQYYDRGEKAKANQIFEDYLEHYPDNLAAYQKWADLALGYNDNDEATELINKVMAIDSLNPVSAELQGRLYYQTGHAEIARKYFEKLLADNHGSAPIYYYLARDELQSNGATTKAANMAMNAANMSQGGRRELLLLSRIYFMQEKYKMARNQLERALKIYPDDSEFYYEAGRTLIKLGEKKEARQNLQNALKYGLPENLEKECRRLLSQL